ncbi:HNHc domain containing protein [uncultured Caudovirales phage]|uniref:HNHc domain containing protein n=1 Tax=uncultured Caudovirales phage TaxID=2100421 RepID=A0A6J5KK30_9CAUD|nr:HNHc domain containing protein [uncultured Caudovirales phage]CAB4124420.1 HNHc domain containing protein [uncultured Caudovirales phage]CAB5219840.1 HNHc domain containing protein [uncultured Caudovirales phage]
MTTASVRKNKLLEGFHQHHIVPRYLGGTDDPSNLVLLHPYDHAIAHFVRWKIFGTHGDAWAANKLKAWLDDGGMTVKGMHHSEESKKLIGQASAARPRKPHSEKTKLQISLNKAGKPSNRKGTVHSPESIEKMRASHLGQVAWNKGLVGVTEAWNKGKTGVLVAWNKGQKGLTKWTDEQKSRHSIKVKETWAKRKQENLCKPT